LREGKIARRKKVNSFAHPFPFARWKEKPLPTQSLVLLALPMLIVFFPGEVKILFILIPVAFLVVLKHDLPRRPVFFAVMSLFGLMFIGLLGYLSATFIIPQPIEDIIDGTLAHNVRHRLDSTSSAS